MKFHPKISIVIPVYNGENYLKEAIDSALNQTYENIEVIVVNDGSKDKTSEICKSYGNKIKYYEKENGGVSSALNLAIDKMSGDYFSWLSHDDIYLNNKIETQVKYLNKCQNKNVILYSDYLLMNSIGKEFNKPIIFNDKELKEKKHYALLRGAVNGITLLIPKIVFQECGKFNETLRCTQDYDLWWRILKKYDFIHLTDLITKTRIHDKQDTFQNPNTLIEGNKLWINMLEDISKEDKIKYEGSLYNYYYEMAIFLQTTPYEEAKLYCINKCMKIDRVKYEKNPLKRRKYSIKFIIDYVKNYGIIKTIKKILKFKRTRKKI